MTKLPAPAPGPLHFYFDFVSPFGYFAAQRIDPLAAPHSREVEWHAMLQAGIFGFPTAVVDGEPFWGVQTFDLREEWLHSGGW